MVVLVVDLVQDLEVVAVAEEVRVEAHLVGVVLLLKLVLE